jgi:protein TonB
MDVRATWLRSRSSERDGVFSLGLAIALALHVSVLAVARRSKPPEVAVDPPPIQVDIDVTPSREEVKAPPPQSAPSELAPSQAPAGKLAPAPVRKAEPKPADDDPYKSPAEAAKLLTAHPKSDDPVELPTIASGDGNAFGGMQSGRGKGDAVTLEKGAASDGTPGGNGKGVAPAPSPPPQDRSRPIALLGSSSWNCPFPPEADAEQIDRAIVGVQVTVSPDGGALSVSVVSEPGHGFGRAARACALARRYQPAADRSGAPVTSTSLINVRFNR